MNWSNVLKVNIQKAVKRIAPIFTAFVIVVASVVSVNASWSYKELDPTVVNIGEYTTIKIDAPVESLTIDCWESESDEKYNLTSGRTSADFVIIEGIQYEFYLRAFYNDKRYLRVDDVPDGTKIVVNCAFDLDMYYAYNINWRQCYITYFNSDATAVGSDKVTRFDLDQNGYYFEFDLQKPANTKFIAVTFMMTGVYPVYDLDYYMGNINITEYSITMTIPTSYIEQEQLGTIIDQNQTIIDGTPEQNAQVDSAVDKMNGAADGLQSAGDALNSVEKPSMDDVDVSIDSLVPETSILVYTAPILAFWENDTLLAMLIIVLTLVLISWVFFGKKG